MSLPSLSWPDFTSGPMTWKTAPSPTGICLPFLSFMTLGALDLGADLREVPLPPVPATFTQRGTGVGVAVDAKAGLISPDAPAVWVATAPWGNPCGVASPVS